MTKMERTFIADASLREYENKIRKGVKQLNCSDETLLDAAMELQFFDVLYADKASEKIQTHDTKRATVIRQLIDRHDKADRQLKVIDPNAPERQIVRAVKRVYRQRLANIHKPRGGNSDHYAEGMRKWTDKFLPRLTGGSKRRGKAWRDLFASVCGDPNVRPAGQLKLALKRAKSGIRSR